MKKFPDGRRHYSSRRTLHGSSDGVEMRQGGIVSGQFAQNLRQAAVVVVGKVQLDGRRRNGRAELFVIFGTAEIGRRRGQILAGIGGGCRRRRQARHEQQQKRVRHFPAAQLDWIERLETTTTSHVLILG